MNTTDEFRSRVMECIDRRDALPTEYDMDLIQRMRGYMASARGRQLVRRYLAHIWSDEVRVTSVRDILSQPIQESLRTFMPDVYLALFRATLEGVDLPLLVAVEELDQARAMHTKRSVEVLFDDSVQRALAIDFYNVAATLHLRWTYHYRSNVIEDVSWTIPPPALYQQSVWYVTRGTFLKRLRWACPFAERLLATPALREHSVMVTGSIIPMCALNHIMYTETETAFTAMMSDDYWKRSVDFVATNIDDVHHFANHFLIALQAVSANDGWGMVRMVEWREDSEAVRNRHGVTMYFGSADFPYQVQLIMLKQTSLLHAIAQQHLPCIRACYDGERLLCTASCVVSWITRFVHQPPLFGDLVSTQRRSKTVFKYAMRGWGFSEAAMQGLQLPSIVCNWLYVWGAHRMLPWFHPLYNRRSWMKIMSEERVELLLECADDV